MKFIHTWISNKISWYNSYHSLPQAGYITWALFLCVATLYANTLVLVISEASVEIEQTANIVAAAQIRPKIEVIVTADPIEVVSGGQARISWVSTGARRCTSPNGQTSASTSGTFITGPLFSTTDYTVTCANLGSKVSATTSVTIQPIPFNFSTGELIFHSGFESDTKILNADGVQIVGISGIDYAVTKPNDWKLDFAGHAAIGNVNISYEGGSSTERIAEVVKIPREGKPDNSVLQFSLFTANVVDSNNKKVKGRVQNDVYGNKNLREIYYRTDMFLPDRLQAIRDYPQELTWLTISEFWNNPGWTGEIYPFRISVNLEKAATVGAPLRIGAHGQTLDVTTNKWTDVWSDTNTSYTVPFGEWTTLEYFWHEGNAETGRFMLVVTSKSGKKEVVLDIKNFTHHPSDPNPNGLSHFNPLKMYTSKTLIDYLLTKSVPLQIAWDNFEIWRRVD